MRTVHLSPDQKFFMYTEARLLVAMGMCRGDDEFPKNRDLKKYMPAINSALREAVERGTVTLCDPRSFVPLPVCVLESYSDPLVYRRDSVIYIPEPVAVRPDPVMSRADFERFCKSLGVQIRDESDCDAPNQIGYTIRGAAKALAQKYAISAHAMSASIIEATKQNKLRVRNPSTGIPCRPMIATTAENEPRISIDDLNEWLETCGVPYELEVEDNDRVDTASSASDPSGSISRKGVMRVFRVRPNELDNKRYWDDKLGRPPQWLSSARLSSGKRGVSALWDPLLVAHALLQKRAMTLKALDSAIHAHFPGSFEKWEEETGDHRH